MPADTVDALVIFGATGDLAKKGSWGPALADSLLPDGEICHNPMA